MLLCSNAGSFDSGPRFLMKVTTFCTEWRVPKTVVPPYSVHIPHPGEDLDVGILTD